MKTPQNPGQIYAVGCHNATINVKLEINCHSLRSACQTCNSTVHHATLPGWSTADWMEKRSANKHTSQADYLQLHVHNSLLNNNATLNQA
jgi:hypothetical protein